ncbi:MAG TPA: FAD-dependent oxidoreductase [Vicinamibacterales bacterium]
MTVAVVGAGAFGGWTALALRRRGAPVTLIDAWGAGHARASSGGETRVIRATYGSRVVYTRMAARALRLWRDHGAEEAGLLRTTGVLWMFGEDDGFGRASAATLAAEGLRLDQLSLRDAASRFPQVDFSGATSVLWEPEAGYLMARRACAHVVDRFVAEGGIYRRAAAATPASIAATHVLLADGSRLHADVVVFACGPWLGSLFPDLLGSRVTVTRQEVCYFGTPAGDARFSEPALPVWLDCGERVMYGIPDAGGRGFKIADDTSGPPIDPTSAPREATRAGVAAARAFLARRFPALADAPLVGTEVCQYESTPDSHFIVDRHPAADHVWIAGGGSGHGFKMGPAIGELLASCILDGAAPDPAFSLARFAAPRRDGWDQKWS